MAAAITGFAPPPGCVFNPANLEPSNPDSPLPLNCYVDLVKVMAIAGSLWTGAQFTAALGLVPSIYPVVPVSRKTAAELGFSLGWELTKWNWLVELATVFICSLLAHHERRARGDAVGWKLWTSAAVLMAVGWIWACTLMTKRWGKLQSVVDTPESTTDQEAEEVAKMNGILKDYRGDMATRALFPCVAALLGLFASLHHE